MNNAAWIVSRNDRAVMGKIVWCHNGGQFD
jgi:hypothetical protein